MGDRAGLRYASQILALEPLDPIEHNVDVYVHFEDGSRFVATFFTLDNIRCLFEKNRRTGECVGGLYSWASDMILVLEYSDASFEATVRDLLANGWFERAFCRCEDGSSRPWIEAARSGPPFRVVWGLHPS